MGSAWRGLVKEASLGTSPDLVHHLPATSHGPHPSTPGWGGDVQKNAWSLLGLKGGGVALARVWGKGPAGGGGGSRPVIRGLYEALPECRHPSSHEPGRASGITLLFSITQVVKGASEEETEPQGSGALGVSTIHPILEAQLKEK